MEFEEMKKIWDSQNNEALYVVNEEVMHNAVTSKKNKANRLINIDEFGLMLIGIVTGSFLIYEAIVNNEGWLNYLGGVMMFFVSLYVLRLRILRRRGEKRFDRSISGEIDHAIASTKSNIKLGSSMVWWYFLPMGLWIVGLFITEGVEWYYWLFIFGTFSLALWVVKMGLSKSHMPRLRKLEALKAKLEEEV